MERLAIIDHNTHTLFVEDVSDEILAKYHGEEEDYIKDNYPSLDNFSWDYIVSAQYIPDYEDIRVYDIDFENMLCYE